MRPPALGIDLTGTHHLTIGFRRSNPHALRSGSGSHTPFATCYRRGHSKRRTPLLAVMPRLSPPRIRVALLHSSRSEWWDALVESFANNSPLTTLRRVRVRCGRLSLDPVELLRAPSPQAPMPGDPPPLGRVRRTRRSDCRCRLADGLPKNEPLCRSAIPMRRGPPPVVDRRFHFTQRVESDARARCALRPLAAAKLFGSQEH